VRTRVLSAALMPPTEASKGEARWTPRNTEKTRAEQFWVQVSTRRTVPDWGSVDAVR